MPTWGTPKKTRVSKVGSSAIRYSSRIVSALRSPRAAASLVLRQILGVSGLGAFAFPVLSLILPAIQTMIRSYVEAEVRRKLEEERKEIVKAVIESLNEEDRALLRELVPG